MINAIKEYLGCSNKEKEEIWNTGVFVFDTNILLNLYRYSSKTRNQLFDAFTALKERIWLPFQVAKEFGEDRRKVILDTVKKYEVIYKQMQDLLGNITKELHIKETDKEKNRLQKYLFGWLEKNKKENLIVTDFSDDEILDKLLQIFDKKTGKGFSQEQLNEIKIEGQERFDKQIPPGYKDVKKGNIFVDNNIYGDLIIWKEILAFAKENKKNIIFITDDRKEDWWDIGEAKQITGPRIELRKEFNEVTGKLFYMYRMESFIDRINSKENKLIIDLNAKSEILLFSNNSCKISKKELHQYYDSLVTDAEKKIAMLNYELYKKEEINEKREFQIEILSKKYPIKKRPFEIEELIKNNKEQLKKTQKEIAKIKEQIDFINKAVK